MEVKQQRDRAIDLLKFVAVYLMVLSHCLQRLGLGMDSLDHPIGKLIVMVNMPLFIFVTGYFGRSLYSRTLKDLLVSKYKTLIRPTALYALMVVIICDLIIIQFGISIKGCFNIILNRLIYGYWFIWVVIYSSFYSWFFVKLGEMLHVKRVIILLISFALLLIIPDTSFIPCLSSFKAMYSFFLLGMLFRERNWLDWMYSHKIVVLHLSIIGYLIAFYFYKGVWSFYYFPLTPFPLVLYYYVLMIVIGIIGIALLYVTLRGVWEQKKGNNVICKFAELGSYSLAIYLIQGVVMEVADCYKKQLVIDDSCILTIVAIATSVFLTALISFIIMHIKKSKCLSAYLLGK